MSNVFKERRQALVKECCEKNPDFESSKKMVFYLLAIMIITKVIHISMQIAYCVSNDISFQSFSMLVTILVALFFASVIYSTGTKQLVYVALIGAFYSLYKAYIDKVFFRFNTSDALLNIINISFAIVILIQIMIMVFLSINRKCNDYLKRMSEIQTIYAGWVQKQ